MLGFAHSRALSFAHSRGNIVKLVRVLVAAIAAATLFAASAPSARADVDLYVTPGKHEVGGREWRTTCEPYSVTERCRTEIWASVVKRGPRGYVVVNDWAFNNLTYKASPFAVWQDNPLSRSFEPTVGAGGDSRAWRSECFTPLTGRGCRGWIEATVIETVRTPSGSNAYRQVNKWVLNHMIRFDSSPIAPHFAATPIGCENVPGGRNLLAGIVDPDKRGYTVTFSGGAAKGVTFTTAGTQTLRAFQANQTCDDYRGNVNLD